MPASKYSAAATSIPFPWLPPSLQEPGTILSRVLSIPRRRFFHVRTAEGLINLPGSMFYMPATEWQRYVPMAIRTLVVKRGLREAARQKGIFHLRLHPEALVFGADRLFGGPRDDLQRGQAPRGCGDDADAVHASGRTGSHRYPIGAAMTVLLLAGGAVPARRARADSDHLGRIRLGCGGADSGVRLSAFGAVEHVIPELAAAHSIAATGPANRCWSRWHTIAAQVTPIRVHHQSTGSTTGFRGGTLLGANPPQNGFIPSGCQTSDVQMGLPPNRQRLAAPVRRFPAESASSCLEAAGRLHARVPTTAGGFRTWTW
jgi:hypothetical protein